MRIISIFFSCYDFVELFKGESLIRFRKIENVSVMHHFHNIVVVHCFAQLSGCYFHFFKINVPISIVIIQGEYPLETVNGFAISQSAVNDLQKLFEVDVSVFGLKVIYHVEYDLISFIESKLLENFLNLFGINTTTVVFIEEIEGRFEFFNLLF